MTRITSKPIISALSDTGKIFVNDDQDVKQISKHDLMGQIANAAAISYDGSGSGIKASNVQGAITEVKGKVDALGSPVTYKGTVATYAELPTTHNVGDMYNVTADETTHTANMNYCWNGTAWDSLGATTDMNLYYTKTQADSAISIAVTDKELKSKAISIPVASVVANTDAIKSDFSYCYDYSLSDITANSWADIFPASLSDSSVVDACIDGHNLTGAGTIRIYFFAVPSAVANVVIVYQKGVSA